MSWGILRRIAFLLGESGGQVAHLRFASASSNSLASLRSTLVSISALLVVCRASVKRFGCRRIDLRVFGSADRFRRLLRSAGFASCVAAILGVASLTGCDRALLKLHRLTWDHAAAFRAQCGSDAVLSSFCWRSTAAPPPFCCAAALSWRRHRPAALPLRRGVAIALPCRRSSATASSAATASMMSCYGFSMTCCAALPRCLRRQQRLWRRPSAKSSRPTTPVILGALRFVHNLPKCVVLPVAVRVFPPFQQFFPFPPSICPLFGKNC